MTRPIVVVTDALRQAMDLHDALARHPYPFIAKAEVQEELTALIARLIRLQELLWQTQRTPHKNRRKVNP